MEEPAEPLVAVEGKEPDRELAAAPVPAAVGTDSVSADPEPSAAVEGTATAAVASADSPASAAEPSAGRDAQPSKPRLSCSTCPDTLGSQC